MRKTIRILLFTGMLFFLYPFGSKAQNGSIDGCISSGSTSVSGTGGLTGSIAEPVVGLLRQDWQHFLQGFAYKTLDMKIVTATHDLVGLTVKVKLFPNPVNEYLNIQYDGVLSGNEKYSINDIAGRLVLSGKLTDPLTQLNVHRFLPGPYVFLLVNTTTKKTIYCNKFVKLK